MFWSHQHLTNDLTLLYYFFLKLNFWQSSFFSSIELNFVTKQIILGVIRCLNFISRLLQRNWIAKLIRSHLHFCYGYFSSGNNLNQSQSALASFNMLNCAFSIWRIASSLWVAQFHSSMNWFLENHLPILSLKTNGWPTKLCIKRISINFR